MLIVLMMVMLAARLILWFVLVLHQIAILVVVGFAPLLIAGACGPRPAAGYAGATELLVALVFTKTAIFAISLKAGKAPVMAFAPTHSPGAGRGRHEMARHTAPHASGHDQPTMTTADAPRVTACEGTNNSGVPAADVADPRRAPRRYAALPTRDAQDSRRHRPIRNQSRRPQQPGLKHREPLRPHTAPSRPGRLPQLASLAVVPIRPA